MQGSTRQSASVAYAWPLALILAAAAGSTVAYGPGSDTAIEPTSAMKQTYSYNGEIRTVLETGLSLASDRPRLRIAS